MTLAEFYDLLDKGHDWFFQMADDGSAYKAGLESLANLQRIAKQSQEHLALFNQFRDYMNGRITGVPKAKPERPE